MESPLFWPVIYKNKIIRVLDETLLPQKEKYITIKNHKQACRAIKDMKTRAVGQVILTMYVFLQAVEKRCQDLESIAADIVDSRPTLSFKYLTDMILGWAKVNQPVAENILGFLEKLKQKRIKQAYEAAELLHNGDTVLTHCNISGLMPMIVAIAGEKGKIVKIFTTETRPYLQGSRLTAWELQRIGCDVTIIADNTAAQVMKENKITKIIVGADHLAQNGDIANKIGTFQIAILAKYFHLPFYVICPPASGTVTGNDIKIEIRHQNELLEYQGIKLAAKGAKGYYPAFDVTPAELITKHIYF